MTADRWVTFGHWVEQERIARRLSVEEATKRSGISTSTWYNIRHGGRMKDKQRIVHHPSTETLLGVATALDMDPADVFQAAGVPMPAMWSRETAPVPVSAPEPPDPTPGAGNPMLSLMATILGEQRELRAMLQALRDDLNPCAACLTPRPGHRR